MTTTKLLRRLLAVAPPELARATRLPNHCVYATAVGVEVLRAHGVTAEPLSVRISLINRAMAAYLATHDHVFAEDVPALKAAGAFLMDTDGSPPTADLMWGGHLVIWLPTYRGGHLLDLNLGALSRPQRQLALPPACLLQFTPPAGNYAGPDGARLSYCARPDDRAWEAAPDWRDRHAGRRAEVRDRIQRAVQRGAPA